MANWKMVKAFGRAMNSRMGKDGKAAKAINNSEIASKANTPYPYKNDNEDAVQAYRRGQNEGTENFYVGRERAKQQKYSNDLDESVKIWEQYDYDYERSYGPDAAYARAVERSGVENAPNTKEAFAEYYGWDIRDNPPSNFETYSSTTQDVRPSDVSRQISRLEDEQSSERLAKDLGEEINIASEDAAGNFMRKNAKDIPMGDQFDSEMAEANFKGLAKEIEDAIFEALKRHGGERDATDIIGDVTSKYR